MASYLSLSLSHLLASRSIIEDSEKRQLLDEEFNRLMKGKNIQSIFDNATLKYNVKNCHYYKDIPC